MTKPNAKDEADIASEQEEFARQEALWRIGQPNRLQARGRCYNCSDSCQGLFCDTGCRQDYERRQELESRTHGKCNEEKRKVVREVLRLRKDREPNEDKQYFSGHRAQPSDRNYERQLDTQAQRQNKWKD